MQFRVVINIDEGKELAEKMEIGWKTFHDRYLENYYVATDRFLIRQIDGKCIFLNQINHSQALCLINKFKPASCAEWQANIFKPECKYGLKEIWNLDISPDGKIKGTESDVRNFGLFIDSVT